MTEEEKNTIRCFFLTKKTWRRHIRDALQIATEIEAEAAMIFPQREPTCLEDDFLANCLYFMGTARRRKERRRRKKIARERTNHV